MLYKKVPEYFVWHPYLIWFDLSWKGKNYGNTKWNSELILFFIVKRLLLCLTHESDDFSAFINKLDSRVERKYPQTLDLPEYQVFKMPIYLVFNSLGKILSIF